MKVQIKRSESEEYRGRDVVLVEMVQNDALELVTELGSMEEKYPSIRVRELFRCLVRQLGLSPDTATFVKDPDPRGLDSKDMRGRQFFIRVADEEIPHTAERVTPRDVEARLESLRGWRYEVEVVGGFAILDHEDPKYPGTVSTPLGVDQVNKHAPVDANNPKDLPDPVPMLLWCPSCGARHVDQGEWQHRVHKVHSCQECGLCWRPAVVPTVGVQFLPGFHNDRILFVPTSPGQR